jgi:hypothetical protein
MFSLFNVIKREILQNLIIFYKNALKRATRHPRWPGRTLYYDYYTVERKLVARLSCYI